MINAIITKKNSFILPNKIAFNNMATKQNTINTIALLLNKIPPYHLYFILNVLLILTISSSLISVSIVLSTIYSICEFLNKIYLLFAFFLKSTK